MSVAVTVSLGRRLLEDGLPDVHALKDEAEYVTRCGKHGWMMAPSGAGLLLWVHNENWLHELVHIDPALVSPSVGCVGVHESPRLVALNCRGSAKGPAEDVSVDQSPAAAHRFTPAAADSATANNYQQPPNRHGLHDSSPAVAEPGPTRTAQTPRSHTRRAAARDPMQGGRGQ